MPLHGTVGLFPGMLRAVVANLFVLCTIFVVSECYLSCLGLSESQGAIKWRAIHEESVPCVVCLCNALCMGFGINTMLTFRLARKLMALLQ